MRNDLHFFGNERFPSKISGHLEKIFTILLPLTIVTCLFNLSSVAASPKTSPRLTPEALAYDVSVFNLLKSLQVEIRLVPSSETDLYTAHLNVKAVGLAKVLFPYKHCEFSSRLRFLPEKNRFRTEYFEKELISDKIYKGFYRFDYAKGVVVGQGFINDRPLEPETFMLPIQKDVYYDDLLSLLYNFRIGGYGDLQPGQHLKIFTIPTRHRGEFDLEVVSKKGQENFQFVEHADYLLALDLRKKYFGMTVDRFFIWLTDEFLPIRVAVPNVIGWGDIVGIYRDRKEIH